MERSARAPLSTAKPKLEKSGQSGYFSFQTMNSIRLFLSLAAIAAMPTFAAVSFPDVSQLPSQPALPDPLVTFNGRRVATNDEWTRQRRPELKALFEHYMY